MKHPPADEGPRGVEFVDRRTWLVMRLVSDDAPQRAGWLVYWGESGGVWESLREATAEDRAAIDAAFASGALCEGNLR